MLSGLEFTRLRTLFSVICFFALPVVVGCNTTKQMDTSLVGQDGYFEAVDEATSSTVSYSFSSEVSAGEARPYTQGYEEQYDAFTVLVKHDMPGRVDKLSRRYLEKRTGGVNPEGSPEIAVDLQDFKIAKWVHGDKGEKLEESLEGEEPPGMYATKMSVAVSLRENDTIVDSTVVQVETEREVPAGGTIGDWESLTAELNRKYMNELGQFMEKNGI